MPRSNYLLDRIFNSTQLLMSFSRGFGRVIRLFAHKKSEVSCEPNTNWLEKRPGARQPFQLNTLETSRASFGRRNDQKTSNARDVPIGNSSKNIRRQKRKLLKQKHLELFQFLTNAPNDHGQLYLYDSEPDQICKVTQD